MRLDETYQEVKEGILEENPNSDQIFEEVEQLNRNLDSLGDEGRSEFKQEHGKHQSPKRRILGRNTGPYEAAEKAAQFGEPGIKFLLGNLDQLSFDTDPKETNPNDFRDFVDSYETLWNELYDGSEERDIEARNVASPQHYDVHSIVSGLEDPANGDWERSSPVDPGSPVNVHSIGGEYHVVRNMRDEVDDHMINFKHNYGGQGEAESAMTALVLARNTADTLYRMAETMEDSNIEVDLKSLPAESSERDNVDLTSFVNWTPDDVDSESLQETLEEVRYNSKAQRLGTENLLGRYVSENNMEIDASVMNKAARDVERYGQEMYDKFRAESWL
jgi:hypothetical protein